MTECDYPGSYTMINWMPRLFKQSYIESALIPYINWDEGTFY